MGFGENTLLENSRSVTFQQIVQHIEAGHLWKIVDHPDPERYPGQHLYYVAINNYIHVVPFEIRNEVIRLITIIPNRKVTKQYRKEQL